MGDGVDGEKRETLRRFAALGAVSPLAGLARTETDGDTDARAAILGYLGTTPGAHFSKIRDDLGLATGETQHHLRRLSERNAVESRRDGDYRRYVPAGRFSEFEQVALGYLRRETPRGMVVALLETPDASGAELAERLDVSRPAVSNHAADLERADLLARDDGYRLKEPETLLILLVRFADSFGQAAESLANDANDLLRYDP